MTTDRPSILGVIVAGGGSRRFAGGDKACAELAGIPLLARVARRVRPQVDALIVNGPQALAPITGMTVEVIADTMPGQGPLGGIVDALAYARDRGFTHVASFPCDTPFFPMDTVARLLQGLSGSEFEYATVVTDDDEHRIFGLWPTICLPRLADAFTAGLRKLKGIEGVLRRKAVCFSVSGNGPRGDPFFNINTAADLAVAEHWLKERKAAQADPH